MASEIGLLLRIRGVQDATVRGLRRQLRSASKEQSRATKRESTERARTAKQQLRDGAKIKRESARAAKQQLRDNAKIKRGLERRDRDALKASAQRERSRSRENRLIDRALATERKRQRQAHRLTLEGVKQTEQLREQRKLVRQQARKELGIGPKRRFDPDAPATNLSIAAAATGRFARAGRTQISELITDAGDLEKAIADVANLTSNIDEEQVIGAIEAASVQFGTSQMNQVLAYYSAVSAGATTATEAQDVLNAANQLSIVGRSDQETAVLAITKAVANFGEQGVTAEKAATSLFGAIQGGQLDATDLANAFPRVAKQASLAGLSMEETVGTLAFFTRTMANADEAGTALSQALATIGKGADKGSKAFKEANRLSIDFSRAGVKAAGGWKGFVEDILENPKFNERTIGRLFESKRARAAIDAMSGDLSNFDEIVTQASTASTALASGMDKVAATKGFQFKQQQAELEKLKLTAGRELLPVMVELGQALSPMIKDLAQFVKDNPWLAKVAVASVAGASVLSPVLQAASVAAGLSGGRGFGAFAAAGGGGGAAAGAAPLGAGAALFGPQRTAGTQLKAVGGAAGRVAGALSAVAVVAGALAVGWEVGTLIDKTLGISDAFSKLAENPLIDELNAPGMRTTEELGKLGRGGLAEERLGTLEGAQRERGEGVSGAARAFFHAGFFERLAGADTLDQQVKQARKDVQRERGGPKTFDELTALARSKIEGQATIRVIVEGPGKIASTDSDNMSDAIRLEVDQGLS